MWKRKLSGYIVVVFVKICELVVFCFFVYMQVVMSIEINNKGLCKCM